MPRIIELYDAPPHSAAVDVAPMGWMPYQRLFLKRGKGAHVRDLKTILKPSIKSLRKGFVRMNGVDIEISWYMAWRTQVSWLQANLQEGDILVVRGTVALTCVMNDPSRRDFRPEEDESIWSVWTYRGSQLWSENPDFPRVPVMPILPPTIRSEWVNATEQDFAKVVEWTQGQREWEPPQWNFTHPAVGATRLEDYTNELGGLLLALGRGPLKFVCDIETRAGAISCIGFCWNDDGAVCVPLMSEENLTTGKGPHFWTEEEELHLWGLMRAILEHPNARVIGHNFNYDFIHLWTLYRIIPRFWMDTMHVMAAYDPKRPKSLAALASYLSPWYRYWKAGNKSFFEGGDEAGLWHYNCLDVWHNWQISKILEPLLLESGPTSQYRYLQRMFYPFTAMTLRGLVVDLPRWQELQRKVEGRLVEIEGWIERNYGPLSVTSTVEVSDAISLMDLVAGTDTSSRRGELLALVLAEPEHRTLEEEAAELVREAFTVRTAAPAVPAVPAAPAAPKTDLGTFLQEVKPQGKALVAQVVKKQSYNENALSGMKAYSQFHTLLLDKVIEAKQLHSVQSKVFTMRIQNWNGGRPGGRFFPCMRSAFSLTGSITHRLSSSKTLDGWGGNLQTFPREPYPKVGHIRSAIVPRPGYKFISCDLSRGDMQVLARTSTTGDMKQKLEDGYDLYLATGLMHRHGNLPPYASLVEGSPTYAETRALLGDSLRHRYKTGVLAIGYGAKGARVGVVFDQPPKFGESVIQAYYAVAPEVGAYQESVGRLVRQGLPVTNHYGMECTFPERDLTNALAWGPQSVVARYVNECWMFATVRWPNWKVVLQVHDELIFEVPEEECEEWDAHAVSLEFQENVRVPASHLYPEFSLPFHASEPLDRWTPLGFDD